MSNKLAWRLYSSFLGAATTIIAQKLVTQAWRVATGEQPPDPNDPEVPFSEAAAWAIAVGVGVGVAQLSMNRYVNARMKPAESRRDAA